MADEPASLEAIHRLAEVLTRERVSYAFIGGIALNAWAIPRATFDLDLAVSVDEDRVSVLLDALAERGFIVDPVFRTGFRDRVAQMEKIHVHLPAGATLMAVDLFLGTTPFLRSLIERRQSIDLGRGPIAICTAADLILLKLIADRPKDRVDVANILAVQGVPERDYLDRWARALGIEARLRAVV
jgi:hypothetical protein